MATISTRYRKHDDEFYEGNRREEGNRLASRNEQQQKPRVSIRDKMRHRDNQRRQQDQRRGDNPSDHGSSRRRDSRNGSSRQYNKRSENTRRESNKRQQPAGERRPHSWNNDRKKPWNTDEQPSKRAHIDKTEYPPLSASNHGYTPESRKSLIQPNRDDSPTSSRQRMESTSSSTDWASMVDDYEMDLDRAKTDLARYKRKLQMSYGSTTNRRGDNNPALAEIETDESVLMRRQKQINYGKNTLGYDSYSRKVHRSVRVKGKDPFTPNKFQKVSRRSWDVQVKLWRLNLHKFDPQDLVEENEQYRKEHTTQEPSSQASSEADTKTDVDLSSLDASMNSMMSDCYLASNESSRLGTPTKKLQNQDDVESDVTSDVELDSGSEDVSECTIVPEVPVTKLSSQVATPTVTPADAEQDTNDSQYCPPQLNPTALMAALQHAASFQKDAPSNISTNNTLQSTPQITLGVNENLNNMLPTRGRKVPTILDNFNLDMCFIGDNELNMDELD